MTIHLNLGANLGDRAETLGRAVSLLREVLPGRLTCSQFIESPAWGYDSANPFLNVGVMVNLVGDMSPTEVLNVVQRVQSSIDPSPHRDPSGRYIDRRIDIDIIAVDDLVYDSPRLTLPHPRMHLRRFVLEPLMALDPSWRHPLLHLTPSEMLRLL